MQFLNMVKFHTKLSRRVNCEVLEHFSQHLASLVDCEIASVSIETKENGFYIKSSENMTQVYN